MHSSGYVPGLAWRGMAWHGEQDRLWPQRVSLQSNGYDLLVLVRNRDTKETRMQISEGCCEYKVCLYVNA